MADITLRPYQGESATNIRGAFMEGVRGVLLVAPTGSGKTVLFSHIAKGAAARGNRVLILAHRDTLINQASGKLSEYGVQHGIIMSDYVPTPGAMVQVGSVQTMVKRIRKQRYDFQLIIVDECLRGDSVINTDIGEIPISDVPAKKPKYVLSLDGTRKVYRKILGFKRTENKQTIHVTHAHGGIFCTPDHLFLTKSGWKKAKNLCSADCICVPADVNSPRPLINGDMLVNGYPDIAFTKERESIGKKDSMPWLRRLHCANVGVENKSDCNGRLPMLSRLVALKRQFIRNSFSGINVVQKIGRTRFLANNTLQFLVLFSEIPALFIRTRKLKIRDWCGITARTKQNGRNIKPRFFPALISLLKPPKMAAMVRLVFEDVRRVYQHLNQFMSWLFATGLKSLRKNGLMGSEILDLLGGFATTDQETPGKDGPNFILKDTISSRKDSLWNGWMLNLVARVCNQPENISLARSLNPLPPGSTKPLENTFQTTSYINWSPIVGVKEDLVCDVFDIEVEDTHCFFANGILVHNCHLSCAATYLEILDAFPGARILGVTGSPCRLDGRGLGTNAGGRFDFLIESVSMRELIDDGYGVQPIVYAPLDRLDLSKVPKDKGDYQKRALSKAMNTSIITGNAIDHYRHYAKHIPAVTWCVDLEHASDTARDFNAAGIKSVMLQGTSTTDERNRALRQLADGTISNITFCQLLVEGVDCPAIGCIIGLRPTYSLAAYLQTLGRMSRPIYAPGFDLSTREGRFAAMRAGPKGLNGIFLDHAGLTFRHGFQDDIREWSLEGAPKKSKREASVAARQCPRCRAVFKPEAMTETVFGPACPVCGHVFEVQKRQIKVEEGTLGQLTPEMFQRNNNNEEKRRRNAEVRQAETLEDFQRIAQERGYSPYWARIQMRMKSARDERKAKEKENQGQLWSPEQLQSLDKEAQAMATHPKFSKEWDL